MKMVGLFVKSSPPILFPPNRILRLGLGSRRDSNLCITFEGCGRRIGSPGKGDEVCVKRWGWDWVGLADVEVWMGVLHEWMVDG